MTFFNRQDKENISKALTLAEQETSGEVIAVVTRQSDDYRFIALLWAALIALALPLILIFLPKLTNWIFSFQPPENIYLIQIISFILLTLFFQWRPVRFFCTPDYIKKHRAHRHAMEQFISQDLHHTTNRKGVLIFVSLAERYIEVIADRDVYNKVQKNIWQDVVNVMNLHLSKNQPAEGFIRAIKLCGQVLQENFPPEQGDKNELPNHLIEL